MSTHQAPRDVELPAEQRSAMVKELFAINRSLYPDAGMQCFCGSDADLIRALTEARGRAAREQDRER